MPPADAQPELDTRFPSGEWMGFYIQPDSRQRHKMSMVLEFDGGKLSGRGCDPIGDFVCDGNYDNETGVCSWAKQYVGRHRVEYSGLARSCGIVGHWHILGLPAFWTGPFFIWPRAFGDVEARFEKAFLEYELTEPETASPTESTRIT